MILQYSHNFIIIILFTHIPHLHNIIITGISIFYSRHVANYYF